MLAELKKSWATFKKGAPGERFQSFYKAQKEAGGASRFVLTVLGAVLLVGGVILLFIPGPGILLIAFGGALVAQQSLWTAKLLDRTEVLGRKAAAGGKRFWRKASTPLRVLIVAAGLGLASGATYLAYLWLFKK